MDQSLVMTGDGSHDADEVVHGLRAGGCEIERLNVSHLHPYASRLVEVGPLPNQLTTEQINFDANFNQRLADESLIVLKQILRDQAGVVDGTLLA